MKKKQLVFTPYHITNITQMKSRTEVSYYLYDLTFIQLVLTMRFLACNYVNFMIKDIHIQIMNVNFKVEKDMFFVISHYLFKFLCMCFILHTFSFISLKKSVFITNNFKKLYLYTFH